MAYIAHFSDSLDSRLENAFDSIRWLEDLPDREQLHIIWSTASVVSRSVLEPELTGLRAYIGELQPLREVNCP